jgi:hypothetical protein
MPSAPNEHGTRRSAGAHLCVDFGEFDKLLQLPGKRITKAAGQFLHCLDGSTRKSHECLGEFLHVRMVF